MKFFVAFFFNITFFVSIVWAQKPFKLSEIDQHTNLNANMSFYVDSKNSDSIKTLSDKVFIALKKANFGISKDAVWGRVEIVNDTLKQQKIVLFNPLASMDEIDVYVYKNGVEAGRYALGDTRALKNNPLQYRLSGISLEINSDETYIVFARNYHPSGINIVEWQIRKQSDFMPFVFREMLFWGVFAGMIMALIVYNIGLFFALKERFFAFYSLLALMSVLFQLSINGLAYMFQIRLDVGQSAVYGLMFGIFSLLFGLSFFSRITLEHSKFTRIAYAIAVLAAIWVVLMVLRYPSVTILAKGAQIVGLLTLTFAFVIAILGLYHRYEGARYFFAGQVSIFLAYFYQIIVRAGLIDAIFTSSYVVAVCSFFDILLISVAISQKIKKIETDRQNNAKMITIQSRFAVMGKTAANILHQWRQPITHIGTIAMLIESVIRDGKDPTAEKLRSVIPKLHSTIDFMTQTVLELNELYKSDSDYNCFEIKTEVSHILEMLQEKINYFNISIEMQIDERITVVQYKNVFLNVLMSIIDNALDILTTNNVQNGTVHIAGFEKNGVIVIEIADNAGGIRIRPLEAVFDPFVSSKENSSGLGLPIAKMMVEQKLGGTISVQNRNNGALFRITFPRKVLKSQ